MGGGKQSVVSRLGYLRLLKLLAGNHCTCRKLHPSAMPFSSPSSQGGTKSEDEKQICN
jgi:hypothetical protein